MVNAIRTARLRSRSPHPTSEVGMCLREVRECFGVGPKARDAAEAWHQARFPHTKPAGTSLGEFIESIPRGVPVFWVGGSAGHGHIAISTGFGGRCWSTDIRRPGYFDKVPISEVTNKWGMTFAGWSEDLNGAYVWAAHHRKEQA